MKKAKVILDGVMGGRSTGTVEVFDNQVNFQGSVSFKNNGGFVMLKSRLDVDLSNKSGGYVELIGDGNQYNMLF